MLQRRYLLGLDLGQASDFTALSIIEQVWNPEIRSYQYNLSYLNRPKIGTPYPDVVAGVKKLIWKPELRKDCSDPPYLVVDKTGVGAPVVDMFNATGVRPISITITGGMKFSHVPHGYHVPKRDLVMRLVTLFQTGRFKIAAGIPLSDILINELKNFKIKINTATGNDSYEAWRDKEHDDLVLSVSLACWFGEHKFNRRGQL